MKAWMKYFALGTFLIGAGVLWLVYGGTITEAYREGFWPFVVWVLFLVVSLVAILFGSCIWYELSEQWYQSRSGGISWVAKIGLKFRSWLSKDGF